MKTLGIATLTLALVAAFGFAHKSRPALTECGDLLPTDSQYGLLVKGNWDTSSEPASGTLTMTLTDLATGESPRELPAELELFRTCAMDAIGVS